MQGSSILLLLLPGLALLAEYPSLWQRHWRDTHDQLEVSPGLAALVQHVASCGMIPLKTAEHVTISWLVKSDKVSSLPCVVQLHMLAAIQR